jgi:hypothetical protein
MASLPIVGSADPTIWEVLAMFNHAVALDRMHGGTGYVCFPEDVAHFAPEMVQLGWIIQEGDWFSITDQGRAAAGPVKLVHPYAGRA